MITFRNDKVKVLHSLSLLNSTIFRTKPIRYAATATNEIITFREKKASDCYTFLFGQSGFVQVSLTESRFQLDPYSLLLIPPNIAFSIEAQEKQNARFLGVEFDLTPADVGLNSQDKPVLFLKNARELCSLFDELQTISDERYAYGEALLLLIFEKARLLACKKGDPYLLYRHALKRIKEQFADAPSSTLIAFGTHYTPDHLSRLLKSSHGITLSALMKQERLKILKAYLRFTSLSEERIASLFGFTSLDAMVSFFRYHTAKTPKDFRQCAEKKNLETKGQKDE